MEVIITSDAFVKRSLEQSWQHGVKRMKDCKVYKKTFGQANLSNLSIQLVETPVEIKINNKK